MAATRTPAGPIQASEPLLRAVELHSTSDLADDSWSDLLEAVGEDGAVELTLVAGWYHAISFTVRALRLPLEPGTAAISG